MKKKTKTTYTLVTLSEKKREKTKQMIAIEGEKSGIAIY